MLLILSECRTHKFVFFATPYRELFSNGEDIIDNLLSELTEGLINISQGGIPKIDGGPLGEIAGILDKFNLDFGALINEFKDYYNKFKSDIISGDSEYQELIALKPISLPRFSNILQIGSKLPSVQYSPDLKGKLWDKLVLKFPSSTYNGVKIPNLPLGESFAVAFPTRGEFPGKSRLVFSLKFGRAWYYSCCGWLLRVVACLS